MISHFDGADRYLSGVVACTARGTGVGAVRILINADGSTITERLEALDEITHALRYVLLTDTPFRDCVTTMNVHDLGPGRSDLDCDISSRRAAEKR